MSDDSLNRFDVMYLAGQGVLTLTNLIILIIMFAILQDFRAILLAFGFTPEDW